MRFTMLRRVNVVLLPIAMVGGYYALQMGRENRQLLGEYQRLSSRVENLRIVMLWIEKLDEQQYD